MTLRNFAPEAAQPSTGSCATFYRKLRNLAPEAVQPSTGSRATFYRKLRNLAPEAAQLFFSCAYCK
ncbi:MAG: hypothetical protein LBF89_05670 [Bacteroidales bacterium]|nr:hypothetical protein [Bacteroidales bacterium]